MLVLFVQNAEALSLFAKCSLFIVKITVSENIVHSVEQMRVLNFLQQSTSLRPDLMKVLLWPF